MVSRQRKILPTTTIGSKRAKRARRQDTTELKGEEPALKAKRDYPFDARIRFDTESTVVP